MLIFIIKGISAIKNKNNYIYVISMSKCSNTNIYGLV